MNIEPFIGLIQNAALLLAVAYLFDIASRRWRAGETRLRQGLMGLALGAVGITVMLTSWTFGQGIVFDTRSVLLGLSGLFFGTVPTAIAMAMTAAFRIYQGGAGVWTGVAVILASGLIGIAWRHGRRRPLSGISWRELILFGIAVHLTMLLLMLTLPWETALQVLSNIALPVILIYPAGTALLGALMVNRMAREQIDEAIRESEDRYRSIFDNSIDAVLLTAPDGRILAANPEACRIFGRTEEEICRLGREGILDRKDPRLAAALEERKRTGQFRGEITFTRKDGTPFPGEVTSVLFRDRNGNPKTSMIIRDISEFRQTEAKLRLLAHRNSAILAAVPDIIMEVDDGKRYVWANQAGLAFFGEEVIGREASDYFEGEQEVYNDVQPLFNGSEEVICLESWQRRRDGEKRLLSWWCKVLKDEQGHVTGALSTARDITDFSRLEEELRDSEIRFREMFNDAPVGYHELDREGRITRVNRTELSMLGYGADEMVGRHVWEFVEGQEISRKAVLDKLEGVLPLRQNFERNYLKKDGTKIPVLIQEQLLRDKNGTITGIRSTLQNIIDIKRAEKQVQETLDSLRKAVNTTIRVMVTAVEARDPYTAGHQARVADLARYIAKQMGLPQDKIDGIRMAGSIHDIGKLSIPAELLSKPTKLSDLEFRLIKEHARQGYEILKDVESPWPLAEIVYQHHERMDGSGYPRNLKGDEMLIEARILCVADVVEAMASHRPYRPGLGIDAALEEISRNRGILYDPDAVNACLRLFKEKGFKFV